MRAGYLVNSSHFILLVLHLFLFTFTFLRVDNYKFKTYYISMF